MSDSSDEEIDYRLIDDSTENCEYDTENYVIDQYVQGVIDFSSQYGSEYSISYTASNIIGKPSKYPEYGDFPETFAMRTYGNWWLKAPSHTDEFQSQNLSEIPAHDFIVVFFEAFVIPKKLTIFETYNPGAIIRIWAYTIARTWVILWENTEFHKKVWKLPQKSRLFSPPLNKIHLPTNILRLEFNHTYLDYFSEIDSILFSGRNVSVPAAKKIVDDYKRFGSIMGTLQTIRFKPKFKQNYKSRLQDFLANDLKKFVPEIKTIQKYEQPLENSEEESKIGFLDMPFEIILKIFSHLDLISLFKTGRVCRYLYDISCHQYLYNDVNLKPYWHLASVDLLCTLGKRASNLKRLDLSRCGLYNNISATEFKQFIQHRGESLTHLRLNSCKFLNASCVETIGIVCDNLKELSLRNLSTEPPILNFSHLCNLKHLERLDLFQTFIEPYLLLTMLENNPKLKHLNLAFAGVSINMDDVAAHIAKYNKELVSLDMWKSHFFSATGLQALSNCHELEEVDFGWCLRENSISEPLKDLLVDCPKIKKLFLGAVRGLCDNDISNIASMCKNLEQLDLMGVIGISKERYIEVLQKCKKLKLMDLSFCDNVDELEVKDWINIYDVQIKCSHFTIEYPY